MVTSDLLIKDREQTPLSPTPPYSSNVVPCQTSIDICVQQTLEILRTRPNPPEDKPDLDYFLQPDGTIIRVKTLDYRDPNNKKYPNAVPILWEEWLEGEGEGPGALEINDSTIIVATGLKGSGKSLLLAWLGAKALAIGMPVWSNMGIKFCLFTYNNELKLCESRPLDWNALLMLSRELENGAAIIDELRYYASSRQSSSVRNRIINVIINQVRKRTLDFYASVKFLRQIDVDIRDEICAEFACEDMALSPKGLKFNIEKGCLIKWEVRDISGWSGYPISRRGMLDYEPRLAIDDREFNEPIYGRHRSERYFNGRPFWPIYNSYEVVDLVDAFRKVRFDLEETVITDKQQPDEAEDLLGIIIDRLKDDGYSSIPCDEFREIATSAGVKAGEKQLGKVLKDKFGVRRQRKFKNNLYILGEDE